MSRHGEIVLPLGEEEHTFRLGLGELRAIEERCNAGAPELMARLAPLVQGLRAGLDLPQLLAQGLMGSWRIDDVREVILRGLIGGGMEPTRAGVLVRAKVDPQLNLSLAPLAFAILAAAWTSPVEDPPDSVGEPAEAPRPRPSRSRTAARAGRA